MAWINAQYRFAPQRPADPVATRRALLRLLAAATVGAWFCATACRPGPGSPIELTLSQTQPANGEVLATSPAAVRAFLNFDIDAGSISSESMRVSIGSTAVDGAVSVDPWLASALVFTPTTSLPADVVVRVVVDGRVRSRNGATLGTDREFSFTIAPPGAVSLQLGPTQVLWSGPHRPRLAPMVPTSADEIGLAFHTDGLTYAAAFWHQGTRQWSNLAGTVAAWSIPAVAALATAADGEGGMLVVSDNITLHHARSLDSRLLIQAGASWLQRIEPGPATAWSATPLLAGTSFASFDWDSATDTWAANLAVQAASAIPDPVACVPLGPDGAQWLSWQSLPGQSTQQLQARSRDRSGIEGAPVVLGAFPFASSVTAAVAPSGRALVVVLALAPFGRELFAIEHVPGQGWATPTSITKLPSGTFVVDVALADSGAAVVAANWTAGSQSSVFLGTRTPTGAWLPVTDAPLPSSALLGLDVEVTDAGEACVALAVGGDLWVFARPASGPWSAPASMCELGRIPGGEANGIAGVEVAAIAGGRFLLAEKVTIVGVGYALQSVELTVQ